MADMTRTDDGICLSKLDQKEQALADLLKEGSRDDLKRDAKLLKEMGKVYCERGLLTKDVDNFVKSAALINAAMLRTRGPGLVEDLERQLKTTELSFCKVLSLTPEKTPLDFRFEVNSRLDEIRKATGGRVDDLLKEIQGSYSLDVSESERVSAEKVIIEKTQHIFGQLREKMVGFLRYLLSESENILGPPPQEYAAIGLGSLARGDTTPYSDLEWAILVEDESKDIGYFKNLVRLVHLFVLNIQETLLKSLAIKSLNDYDTADENWFEDKVAPRGLQFDSAAPYACNTPLGRPDRPTKEGRELIRTPQRMAQLCEYETALKEGYNIDRIMTSVLHIGGSNGAKKLVDEFTSIRTRVKTNPNIQIKAFEEILGSFIEFLPKLDFHRPSNTVRDIKKSMFRLPTLIVTLFKSYYGLSADITWEVLEEMFSTDLLTSEGAHNLKCMVSISSLLRLATYWQKKCQNELISILPEKHPSASSIHSDDVAYFDSFVILFIRYCFTMNPLSWFIFCGDGLNVGLRYFGNSFYEDNDRFKGEIELNCCLNEEARNSFFKHIDKRSTKLSESNKNIKAVTYKNKILYKETDAEVQECFSLIGRTYEFDFNYSLQLQYVRLAVDMCKTTGCRLSKVAEYDAQMANSLMQTKDYGSAAEHAKRALDTFRHLKDYGDSLEEIAVILDNMGCLLLESGDCEKAIECSTLSVEMLERLFGEGSHPHLAESLTNLGNFYCVQNNFQKGLHYFERSRDMLFKIHGNGAHPDVALNLEHTGHAHFMEGNYRGALQYFSEALTFRRKLHGENVHPRLVHCLNCLWSLKIFDQKYDEATGFLKEALTTRNAVFREPQSSAEFDYLVQGLRWLCKIQSIEKSQFYLVESLRIRQRLLGDHWETILNLVFVAKTLCYPGKFCKALEYLDESDSMMKRLAHVGAHSGAEINENVVGSGNIFNKIDSKLTMQLHVLHEAGSLYFKQHAYHDLQSALDFFTRDLKILTKVHNGRDHSDIACCLDSISDLYCQMGDYAISLGYCMDSLQMHKRLHGNNDCLETAASLHCLARLYLDMCHAVKALKYCKLSLDMFQRLQRDSPEIPRVLNTLGQVYKGTGNLKLSLKYHLAVVRNIPKNRNEGLRSTILTNIGNTYRHMGDYGQALKFHSESLSLKRKLFNEDHKSIADSLSFIGLVKRCLGEVDEALKYQDDSLKMKKRLYGDVNHFEIAISLTNIGNLYCDKGELDKALDYHSRGLDMKKRVYFADHQEIVISLGSIMLTYIAKKEWDAALQYGTGSLDMLNRLQKGRVSPNAPVYLLQIGMVYAMKRNTKKALEHLKNSLAQASLAYGSRDHQVIGKCLNNIGAVLMMVKQYQKACEFLKRSLEMKRRLFGSVNHRQIAATLNNFGMVYFRMAKFDLALKYHRNAFNMRCEIHGVKTHPECINSLTRCTRVCKKTSKVKGQNSPKVPCRATRDKPKLNMNKSN